MLRITCVREEPDTVALRLEGRLAAEWTDLLGLECDRWVSRGKLVSLDLSQVTFVDDRGVRLLRTLREREIGLERMPPLIADLLTS